jgi:hypothetical protein
MWAELLTALLARTAQFSSGHSAAYNNEAAARGPPLMKSTNRKKSPTERPTLPELDQTNRRPSAVSLTSLQSRRSYRHAIDEFYGLVLPGTAPGIEPDIVLRYRLQLEAKKLASSTINVRPAAGRRLAYEAADTGLLSPELVAGIRRVKGVPQLGRRDEWAIVDLVGKAGHLRTAPTCQRFQRIERLQRDLPLPDLPWQCETAWRERLRPRTRGESAVFHS